MGPVNPANNYKMQNFLYFRNGLGPIEPDSFLLPTQKALQSKLHTFLKPR